MLACTEDCDAVRKADKTVETDKIRLAEVTVANRRKAEELGLMRESIILMVEQIETKRSDIVLITVESSKKRKRVEELEFDATTKEQQCQQFEAASGSLYKVGTDKYKQIQANTAAQQELEKLKRNCEIEFMAMIDQKMQDDVKRLKLWTASHV